MKKRHGIVLLILSISIINVAFAGDTTEERTKAAERYLKAMPVSKIMDDSTLQVAQKVPEDKREEFITSMHSLINISSVEKVTKEAMVKTFTADELNALADFYGSDLGKSAMKKFGSYMSEIMPAIQKELMRAAEEAQKSIED